MYGMGVGVWAGCRAGFRDGLGLGIGVWAGCRDQCRNGCMGWV